VRAFQGQRGLRVDGVCGVHTWSSLVEAGYRLGDRLLFERSPALRGDDVAELQRRLGSLGFDAGRVDGIFGGATAHALSDFQRNAGLTVDAICGRKTLDELLRLQPRSDQPELVTSVRERERLRRARRTLEGLRVALGEEGGMGAAVAAVARALSGAGAEVVTLMHPSGSRLAAEANNVGADVYIGLSFDVSHRRCSTSYYASTFHYESAGGRRLAEMLQETVPPAMGVEDGGVHGMSLPVLRETRMPAVQCEIGPPSAVVERAAAMAAALRRVLAAWAASDWG
jgi:N-acetylmuramoyl-L-alanine amidase